ncbi:MAG: ABC-F family ATP-binding cassette domain-containing protein [Actinomycetia bacterium]|nr:ABC-F family ATP-binding cassette domain-containing protein [Actinomycetes bacterium]MCP4959747.1 ABC-F family ATP-binding cassette domain-containing protein [Actinomycetes bacterium]
MLTASGLSRAHGDRVLFRDLTIKLLPGHRTALVGGNGVGKTTLLEILVGIQPADAGDVHRAKGLRLGYLPQDLTERIGGRVIEAAMEGATHINDVATKLAGLEARLATTTGVEQEKVLDDYGHAQSRFEQLGGYALEAEAHRVLAGLGFTPEMTSRQVEELSGGWRMRLALARLLLSEPDLLILDEPTNHLDVDSVAWLEGHLAAWTGALLFVSHDRDFIDGIANRVVEIIDGTVTEYVGGFAEFVVAREDLVQRAEAAAAQQSRKVAHMEKFVERFRYKATKARQVQSRIKAIEKLEAIPVPTQKQLKAKFAFPEPQRSSRVVVEFDQVIAGYDDQPVLTGVDFVVERGRKVALVGPNGAGKTTLVKLLLGDLAPMAGNVNIGNNVDHATFNQHQAEVLNLDRTVFDEFRMTIGDPLDRNLRTVLGSFGFGGDAADRRVGDLSGGEQTRLALAITMANPVNLLVLDEPTNHLDLPSCDLLEDALKAYPGSVVLVTHDRHLIRNVADALVEVRNGEAVWHEGVNEDVLKPVAQRSASAEDPQPKNDGTRKRTADRPRDADRSRKRDEAESRNQRNKATKGLRSRLNKVERQWEAAEAELVGIQDQMADPATYADADKVKELTRLHDETKDRAANLMAEWERLSARLENT